MEKTGESNIRIHNVSRKKEKIHQGKFIYWYLIPNVWQIYLKGNIFSLEGDVDKQMTLDKFNIYFEGHVHNDGGHEMALYIALIHSKVKAS